MFGNTCCATSTSQGFGDLIVAKWTSYLRHVNNKHSNHPPRPSLPEMCSWRNVIKIMDKEWSVDSLMINKNHNDHNDHKHFPSPYSSSFLFESICINSKSYQSLIYFCRNKIKSHLVKHKDYKWHKTLIIWCTDQLLEGFHSTLNQWHPKMICFSWLGTFCRYKRSIQHMK